MSSHCYSSRLWQDLDLTYAMLWRSVFESLYFSKVVQPAWRVVLEGSGTSVADMLSNAWYWWGKEGVVETETFCKFYRPHRLIVMLAAVDWITLFRLFTIHEQKLLPHAIDSRGPLWTTRSWYSTFPLSRRFVIHKAKLSLLTLIQRALIVLCATGTFPLSKRFVIHKVKPPSLKLINRPSLYYVKLVIHLQAFYYSHEKRDW
jgi:hypothetical protein